MSYKVEMSCQFTFPFPDMPAIRKASSATKSKCTSSCCSAPSDTTKMSQAYSTSARGHKGAAKTVSKSMAVNDDRDINLGDSTMTERLQHTVHTERGNSQKQPDKNLKRRRRSPPPLSESSSSSSSDTDSSDEGSKKQSDKSSDSEDSLLDRVLATP